MSKHRVLVVDDEEETRTILSAALRDVYEVVLAYDGLDALDKVDRYQPDFIILDVMMPLMSGIEACTAIRKNPNFKSTPVMFLSAIDSRQDIMKAYNAGANLYLTKPIDPQRVMKNIDLFFRMNPIPLQPKRHTLEEISEMEKGEAKQKPRFVPDTEQQVAAEPAAAPESPEELIEGARAYRVTSKPRVLLVDDDVNVITMMMIALRDDYEIVKALDGLQAVEKIVRYQPDILVVDVMMPKMSGYQLCESLRRNPTFQSMPIIVASAKSSRRDQDYALRCGANAFLAKPFEPGRLAKLIESFVHAEGFSIRKKQISFEQITEEEKEEREKTKKREAEYAKKLQRSELKRHIDKEMQEPPDKKK